MDQKRGAFIVFEGADRSGKSTQCKKLVEYLNNNNIKSELMVFPNRTTEIGSVINRYLTESHDLDDRVIHLLFSTNRWEAVNDINTKLAAGTTIVCDRYSYSGVAYSAAKGLDYKWCKYPEIGLTQPDAVLFFEISETELLKRPGFGGEIYEKPIFQQKVAKVFEKLFDPDYWIKIDADGGMDEVHQNVIKVTEKIIVDVQELPLKSIDDSFIK